jgi:capsular exopolysaccharide synthesis family protein
MTGNGNGSANRNGNVYGSSHLPGSLHWRALWILTRRSWWLVGGLPALIVTGTLAWLLLSPADYRATVVLRLADARRSLTRNVEQTSLEPARSTEQLLSQIQMLRSRSIAEAVVDSSGLRLQPRFNGFTPALLTAVRVDSDAPADTLQLDFQAVEYTVKNRTGTAATAPYGSAVRVGGVTFAVGAQPATHTARWTVRPLEESIDKFIAELHTARRPGTDIVDVSFTAREPALAQRVVNILAAVFQSLEAQNAQNQSKRRRVFLDEQLRRADSLLTQAQQTLSAFRSNQQVYSSRDKLAAQQVALLDLETRRIQLDADRDGYRSLLNQLEQGDSISRRAALRNLAGNAELATNPVVVRLYDQLMTQQRGLDSLRQIAPAENPDVRRLVQLAAGTEADLKAAMRSHAATLDARATALRTQTSRVSAGVRVLPTVEAQEVRLVQQVETIRSLGNQLREERQRAAMAEAIEVGEVEIVDSARLPYKPVSTLGSLKLLLALIFGIGAGIGLALLRERWDVSIRNPEEMVESLQLSSLGLIPKVDPAQVEGMEAYRVLRTRLLLTPEVARARSVVITSAIAGEGKSTTAANLAAAFAWEGRRVLLVDADLWRGRLHRLFATRRSPGLADCLLHGKPLAEAIRSTDIKTLWFMPSGKTAGPPSDLVTGARMPRFLEQLREHFDLVLIDTPPVLTAAETAVLSTSVDGVVLVVRAGHTDREAVQHAVREIAGVGGKLVGAVLNDPKELTRKYGPSYYKSYYSYAREDG